MFDLLLWIYVFVVELCWCIGCKFIQVELQQLFFNLMAVGGDVGGL